LLEEVFDELRAEMRRWCAVNDAAQERSEDTC